MTIASSKDSGFRPPLITPSASPQPHSYSGRDAAPPPKRQRMVSVSRSSSSRLSVGVTESILDMQKEREASRTRLLDTWSQLAERYSRRLDEDDIVDIRTGEIVKDNGFWRTTRKFNFGEALALEGTEGPAGDESQAEESSEDEEGADELDAFSEAPDFLEELFAKGLQPIPTPAANRRSSDTNDLQEFLEAEKRRKEDYGSDVEDGDLEPPYNDSGGPAPSPPIANSEFDDNDDEEHSIIGDRPATSSSVYESAQEESGSEDELDNWEPTEASMVVVASNTQGPPSSEGETDSEVEFVELSVPQKPSQVKRRTPPAQLHTPPLSHSSMDAPNLSQAIPSPHPPSPPHLSVDFTPTMSTGEVPVPSGKYKTRNQYSSPRSPTPEVIEISDDDIPTLGRTSYSPSPPPPTLSSLPPIVRARSRALSFVPEVVIRTLPPRLDPVKANVSPRTSRPSSPVKTTRTKSPPPKSPTKTSPAKKSVKKLKPFQKVTDKAVESRGKIQAVCEQSVSRNKSKIVSRRNSPSKSPLSLGPEIGEQPTAPAPPVGKSVALRDESSPKKRTGQKRKRTSSEHENSLLPLVPTTVSKGKATAKPREVANVQKTRTARHQTSRRSPSKSRHITSSDHDSQSSSEEDMKYQRHHTTRRFASVSTPSNIQTPYTPHATPSHHPGMYPPIADPRAQQIVTQAMQQLAALLWTPTHSTTPVPVYPFTPTHHRFSSVGPSFMHSTPDHPHPYPYSFDPSMSKATLPPSSPEPPSSPIKPRERRKSLVSRSRSRGRRVSFHVEEEVNGWSESEESEPESSPLKATTDRHRSRKRTEDPPKRSKDKGKEKAPIRYHAPSSSESERDRCSDEENRAKPKPATSKRSQTPGPESLPKERASSVSVSSTRPRSPKTASSNPRTRRDGGSRY